MPTGLKTIEYAWDVDSTTRMTALVPYTSSIIDVYFPETGSNRKFQSAWFEITARETYPSSTGRGSLAAPQMSLYINGSNTEAWQYGGSNTGYADTGEEVDYIFAYDCTTAFQNLASTETGSKVAFSFKYSSSIAEPGLRGLCGKMYLTYEYDLLSDRRIKTVTIPCDKTGSVLTALTEIPVPGYPQIPLLDTFCPESNKTFRSIWVEFNGSDIRTGTTDTRLSMSFDYEATQGLGFFERVCSTPNGYKIFKLKNDLDTSTTHSIKMIRTNGSAFFETMGVLVKATYEYDHANSNIILNSLELPFDAASPNYNPTENVYGVFSDDILIEEPEPIDLKQSGIYCHYYYAAAAGSTTIVFQTGSSFTSRAGIVGAGFNVQCTRIDSSGSIRNNQIPITRGSNNFSVKYICATSPYRAGDVNGFIYLNYYSSKHPNGDNVHNHTVRRLMVNSTNYNTLVTLRQLPISSYTASIPESQYYIIAYGAVNQPVSTVGRLTLSTYVIGLNSRDYLQLPFDSVSEYVLDVSQPTIGSGGERHFSVAVWSDQYRKVKRYPTKISDSNRLVAVANPFVNHTMSFYDGAINYVYDSITYHSITYTVTGSLSGSYSGDGSGITVGLFRADNRDLITTGSTTVGGDYSFVWYDNTIPLFVEAIDSDKAGRSLNYYAQ